MKHVLCAVMGLAFLSLFGCTSEVSDDARPEPEAPPVLTAELAKQALLEMIRRENNDHWLKWATDAIDVPPTALENDAYHWSFLRFNTRTATYTFSTGGLCITTFDGEFNLAGTQWTATSPRAISIACKKE